MGKTFKLKRKQISHFYSLLKRKKEYGGNIRILNKEAYILYEKKGEDFKVRMNYKGEYDINYHTHAYFGTLLDKNINEILHKIQIQFNKGDINNGLYLFESNIMRIHPPSPQDCMLCSVLYKPMLVFTQEGVYVLKYNRNTPLTLNDKNDIENKYYKYMWGIDKKIVKQHISSNDPNMIIKILYQCYLHKERISFKKSINMYLQYLRLKNINCRLIEWGKLKNHMFTI